MLHLTPRKHFRPSDRHFRNVVIAVTEFTLGVKSRTIPPAHLQANGPVDSHNRLLDLATSRTSLASSGGFLPSAYAEG